jgi:hypothetical protein
LTDGLANGSSALRQTQLWKRAFDRDDLGAKMLERQLGPVRANSRKRSAVSGVRGIDTSP